MKKAVYLISLLGLGWWLLKPMPSDARFLQGRIDKLRSLHKPLGKPRPGDWLASHREPGQTFQQYIASKPVVPDDRRRLIYIQPLGQFSPSQRKIIALTADFMQRYFSLPVEVKEVLPDSVIPPKARRVHPSWKVPQILTGYVLNEVLKPTLPDDAAVYLAFTSSDLWPGEGWNFVFGEASLRDRVGVWSLYRNGDPDQNEDSFRLCLLRTLRTATHETGHIFSMYHCTAFQCNMCGSNSLQESDRRPLLLCPQCLAKLCWAMDYDPLPRYRKLSEFFKKQGYTTEYDFCEKSIKFLQDM